MKAFVDSIVALLLICFLTSRASAELVGQWTFDGNSVLADKVGNFPDLVLHGNATVAGGKLDVSGSGSTSFGWAVTDPSGMYVGPTMTSKTLLARLTLQGLSDVARAGSALTLNRPNTDQFDAIVFSELENNRWMAGSSYFLRTQNFIPGFEESQAGVSIFVALVYEDLGGGQMRISGYRNGRKIGNYVTENGLTWNTGDVDVYFGVRHILSNGTYIGAIDALIDEACIYNEALSHSDILRIEVLGCEIDLIGHWTFEGARPMADGAGNFPDLRLGGSASISAGKLHVSGVGSIANAWAVSDPAGIYRGPDFGSKTMVARVQLDGLAQSAFAGSVLTMNKPQTVDFDAIVFSELELNRWMAGSSWFLRTQNFDPGYEESAIGQSFVIAISYENVGEGVTRITGYRDGVKIGEYETANALEWRQGEIETFFGIRHVYLNGQGVGAINASIDEACILAGVVDLARLERIGASGCGNQIGDLLFADGLE